MENLNQRWIQSGSFFKIRPFFSGHFPQYASSLQIFSKVLNMHQALSNARVLNMPQYSHENVIIVTNFIICNYNSCQVNFGGPRAPQLTILYFCNTS